MIDEHRELCSTFFLFADAAVSLSLTFCVHLCRSYISHWTTPDSAYSSADIASSAASLNGYRSKDGRGYQPEVRSLGWGAPHSRYNAYVSVRRAEDVLKDYPNREACEKFYNRA